MAGRRCVGAVSMEGLARRVLEAATAVDHSQRYLLGLAGPPAAGKSTLAADLCSALNLGNADTAAVAPMDGFHRSTADLSDSGELAIKGQPRSFDVRGFVARLQELRTSPRGASVGWPVYDRSIHDPVPNGIVFDRHKIAIVEGNYLLLDAPGWSEIRELLDECWFLDAEPPDIERRLYSRHVEGGKSPAEARTKIASSDLPNAELVSRTVRRADYVVSREGTCFLIREPA